MKFNPLVHQQLGFDHLTNNDRALLFAGMGLGKTATVLYSVDELICTGAMKGLLVVAPKRVAVLSWPDEVAKWENFNWLRIANLRTKRGQQAWKEGSADIYTINYEMLPKFSEQFLKGERQSSLPVDSILFDEIDMAKNQASKRIRALRKYIYKIPRRWGMTGTPVSNHRFDIFAQVRLVDDGETWKCPMNPRGTSFGAWKKQYFEVEDNYSQYPKFILRKGSEEALEEKLQNIALVLQSKDYLKIPPVVTHDIEVALPPDAKKLYKRIQKELLAEFEEGFALTAANLAVLRTKLLQITSGAVYVQQGEDISTRKVQILHDRKVEAVRKLAKDNGNKPILVACKYRHEVDRLVEALPGAEEFTNERLDAWNKGEVPFFVAHPKKISHGLNLQQGGNIVCWFTLDDSRGLYDQFNARLARQGQTEETHIYRLFAGDIDHAVAGNLGKKGNDQDSFLSVLNNLKRLNEI